MILTPLFPGQLFTTNQSNSLFLVCFHADLHTLWKEHMSEKDLKQAEQLVDLTVRSVRVS